MGVATEISGLSFPRNLSVWWSEETEYMLQRIERWAAYARGYNRLRSARLSPGRLTMHNEPADTNRWSINQATNRLVVEASWTPNFRHPRRQQQQQQHQQRLDGPRNNEAAAVERTGLRCCPFSNNASYKSNGNLDINCLEAYSLDHSIYFKTVGELRKEVRPEEPAQDNNNVQSDSSPTISSSSSSLPLDCGDFLASDFDNMDEDEEIDVFDEAYELREQLSQLEISAYDMVSNASSNASNDNSSNTGVIQVCRSVINEDDINNNFTRIGLPRQFARPAGMLVGRAQ